MDAERYRLLEAKLSWPQSFGAMFFEMPVKRLRASCNLSSGGLYPLFV